MSREPGRYCGGCRYWSEMLARAIGGPIEAMCLSKEGERAGKYTTQTTVCASYAKNSHGAVDEPPDYGEGARRAYAIEAQMKHPNGAIMFARDGTLLDENGNRSIFDDVDE